MSNDDPNFETKVLGFLGTAIIGAVTFASTRPSEQERCRQDCMSAYMQADGAKLQCYQLCQKDQDQQFFKDLYRKQQQEKKAKRCGPCYN